MVRVHLGPLNFTWSVGQVVKTPPFHGGNTGSNPVRIMKASFGMLFFYVLKKAILKVFP